MRATRTLHHSAYPVHYVIDIDIHAPKHAQDNLTAAQKKLLRSAIENWKSSMEKNRFAELMGSVSEANEILKGERSPSREVHISPVEVRAIRKATGLSQQEFAHIIHVEVSTLRNWEQGRRDPTGPARALLLVIRKNPKETLRALTEAG